jgi:hypothetical protein
MSDVKTAEAERLGELTWKAKRERIVREFGEERSKARATRQLKTCTQAPAQKDERSGTGKDGCSAKGKLGEG